jgi:UDP-N-acetyl-2-amino-2-deoxyglucuronate dehydrogenase
MVNVGGEMKKYVLIGAGYVAPKHYKAIKETGGKLLAILDPHDSVGILDAYFPNCLYFSEFERFDRFCSTEEIDFCVVCSPNYLHDVHCLWGLRSGMSVICEKPLALNPKNLDKLVLAEESSGFRIWNILQLRLSELVIQLKETLNSGSLLADNASLTYFTPRGNWYDYSWKNDVSKSGGLATNIGIHLFDLILQLFGKSWAVISWAGSNRLAAGRLRIGNTTVDIELSIEKTNSAQRLLTIGELTFDLSGNFGNLHTLSYSKILAGDGFGINDVFPAINLCSYLRGWK